MRVVTVPPTLPAAAAAATQVRRCCKLADVTKLAKADLELESLVGLEAVKEYCTQMRRDLIARAALGDEPLVRNVLISGNLGTGKKLGAAMICDMLRALGAAKGITTTEVRAAAPAHRRQRSLCRP